MAAPSPYLASLIEEAAFELEGLAELLRLTGWTPESAVFESHAKAALAIARTVRRAQGGDAQKTG